MSRVFCLFLIALFIPVGALARLSEQDIELALFVLAGFEGSCSVKATEQKMQTERYQIILREVSLTGKKDIISCMESFLSQIDGALRIFENLCREVKSTSSDSSPTQISTILVGVDKYQAGIKPFENLMIGCLREKGVEEDFILSLLQAEYRGRGLDDRLLAMKQRNPLNSNRAEFR